MKYVLVITEKKSLVFYVLACAELFRQLYGGEIQYENR